VLTEELHANLSGLYGFIYRRLVEGNVKRSIEPVGEALKILRHLRETWLQAVEKMDPAMRKDLAARASSATEHHALSVHG
jgi:flagellin-specific chaperone FliS